MAIYIGGKSGRTVDRWEKMQLDYTTIYGTPTVGLMYRVWLFNCNFYVSERITEIEDYSNSKKLIYDTRVGADFLLSNSNRVASKTGRVTDDFDRFDFSLF